MAKRKFHFTTEETIGAEAASTSAEEKLEAEVDEEIKKNLEETKSKVQSLVEKIDAPVNEAFNLKFIKREKLVFHKNNDYPIETVESLAESILDVGLIHNIEVYYDLDNDQYIVEAGEQRTRAIDLLIEKYKNYENPEDEEYKKYEKHVKPFESGYPCNVKIADGDNDILNEINSEIRVIIANELVRGHDTDRKKAHIDRLHELYSKRNELSSDKEKINVNKAVGKALGISERQAKKYKTIDKLIPELLQKFEENEISLNEGANYANLTEEEQRQILKLIENGSDKKEIQNLVKQIKEMKSQIEKSEKDLETLQNEKNEALEKLKSAEQSYKALEKELSQKEESNANKEEIEALERQLAETSKEVENQKRSLTEKVKEKENKIKELEKELEKKNNSGSDNFEVLKNAANLEAIIKQIEQNISTFNQIYKQYEKICKEAENVDKKPTEYLEQITKIVTDFGKKI